MNYWLFKTEPDAFSIQDLKKAGTEMWDGIRNYQARNLLRDQVQLGDKVFIYHSSCKNIGIAGEAKVVKTAYPDPTQFNPEAKYFDPKSSPENPRWVVVDVKFVAEWDGVLPLSLLKQQSALADMALLKRGQRLSVQPVTAQEWAYIQDLRQG